MSRQRQSAPMYTDATVRTMHGTIGVSGAVFPLGVAKDQDAFAVALDVPLYSDSTARSPIRGTFAGSSYEDDSVFTRFEGRARDAPFKFRGISADQMVPSQNPSKKMRVQIGGVARLKLPPDASHFKVGQWIIATKPTITSTGIKPRLVAVDAPNFEFPPVHTQHIERHYQNQYTASIGGPKTDFGDRTLFRDNFTQLLTAFRNVGEQEFMEEFKTRIDKRRPASVRPRKEDDLHLDAFTVISFFEREAKTKTVWDVESMAEFQACVFADLHMLITLAHVHTLICSRLHAIQHDYLQYAIAHLNKIADPSDRVAAICWLTSQTTVLQLQLAFEQYNTALLHRIGEALEEGGPGDTILVAL